MRCRWSEAGRGQVREGTEKHLEGGNEKQVVTHEGNIFKIKQKTTEQQKTCDYNNLGIVLKGSKK